MSKETLQRLGCDAVTATLVHDGRGSPLDLGRRRRTINPAQRIALEVAANGMCQAPGCDRTWFLQGHHIWHWSDGGPTDLANLVLLCPHHHRLLHEGGFSITVEDGQMRFWAPNHTPMAPTCAVPDPKRRQPLPQASGSPAALWGGERLDLGLAIDALVSLEARAECHRRYHHRRDAAASPQAA